MTKSPSDQKNGLKKGPWTPEEDQKLIDYIQKHGHGRWRTLPKNAGLKRCGKSCRLRWTNYLRPDIKRGRFSFEEEETIIQLHSVLGNKWSTIAASLPGRTDNEIKNYWNTHIKKKLLKMGIDPVTHSPCLDIQHLSSILSSSLYNSPQLNNHPSLFGMGSNILNPSLLSLFTALLSSSSSSSSQNPDVLNQNLQPNQLNHSIFQAFQTNHQEVPNIQENQSNQVILQNTTSATNFGLSHLVQYNGHGGQSTNFENQIVPNNEGSMGSFNLGSLLSYSTPSSSASPSTLNSSTSSTTFVNGTTAEDERDTYCSNMLMYNLSNGLNISDSRFL